MNYLNKLHDWLSSPKVSQDIKDELKAITDDKEIEDRFYKDLEFGTGGIRGIIGAGSNRMNVYTVSKATCGYALYLKDHFSEPSVAIAYDSRFMSKEFAETAALVFATNGVKVFLYDDLRPTPMLSFAVGELKCSGGIVITASHNPKQYNGYKVYGCDGGQITDKTASDIIRYIDIVGIFDGVETISESEAIDKGLLVIIGDELDKIYIDKVKSLIIRKDLVDEMAKDLSIIYTPIHGAGLMPVRRALNELGFEKLHIVKEQELPDGNFPTAEYPNPEDKNVFNIALNLAKELNPDLIFGTDPDCDRIGVVVKDNLGEYKVLTGNQTGTLLAHYIISSLSELNKLPKNPTIIKTIVTTEAIRNIANSFGVETLDTLTGFKYIGEKIKEFEVSNSNSFLFGLEESYGYLAGTFVRDKDAVIASALIAEMALYYKKNGLNLYEAMIELYDKYGYTNEDLVSINLYGKEGQEKISKCIDSLRNQKIDSINGVKVKNYFDYKLSKAVDNIKNKVSEINLPKSNVLKYILEDDSWYVVRPSGTEPKMKVYLSVNGTSLQDSEMKLIKFRSLIMNKINEYL